MLLSNQWGSQVFNNSHILLVSSFSLTCLFAAHSVSFHSGFLVSRWGPGMGSVLMHRQDMIDDLLFPALPVTPRSGCPYSTHRPWRSSPTRASLISLISASP